MKILNKIKTTLINLTKSIERFPITIGLSSILMVLFIILNESMSEMTTVQIENFSRINMVVGLGVVLSLCIGLLIERFFYGHLVKSIISYLLGGVSLLLYYYTLLPSFDFVPMSRFIGLVFIFTIGFFFIPWLQKKENYEVYVIKVFSCFFTTLLYSAVLYFGLSAILFTTNTLFDLEVDGKYYYYIFLLVSLVFAISLFLSKLPAREDQLKEYTYSKSLKVLLLYIVIPLISIYTLILYVYFAKILITGEWPKGLVSNLVLWYSAISVGVIFFITPILEDNPLGKQFKTWFPKVIIPILAMMFVSIGLRISQYGITENRYYVVLLGLWVTGIMIYFSLSKPLKNIIIPITLSITLIIAIFGPLSGYSLSIKSQNNRFNHILLENNMLDGGNIGKNTALPKKIKEDLSNIISYFETYHNFKDLKVLPDNFKVSTMESLFGFEHTPQYAFNEQEYFYYNLDLYTIPIAVDGYDYSIHVNTYNQQRQTIENLNFNYKPYSHEFSIKDRDRPLLNENILAYVTEIYKKNGQTDKGIITSIEDMSFEEETKDLKVKFIFTSINGRNNTDTDDLILEGADFILLIHQK